MFSATGCGPARKTWRSNSWSRARGLTWAGCTSRPPKPPTCPPAWPALGTGRQELAYLGDSEPNPAVAELAQGVDLLVVDCAATDENPKKGHIGPTQSGELAQGAGAGKLLLSHLYRGMDPADLCQKAGRVFSGEVIAAEDLLTVEL